MAIKFIPTKARDLKRGDVVFTADDWAFTPRYGSQPEFAHDIVLRAYTEKAIFQGGTCITRVKVGTCEGGCGGFTCDPDTVFVVMEEV